MSNIREWKTENHESKCFLVVQIQNWIIKIEKI